MNSNGSSSGRNSRDSREAMAAARRAANQRNLVSNTPKGPLYRLRAAFFLLGLLNNSLYVVILTAALELLPKGVPTGVVALANIAPALVAKAVWPYLLKGKVRYKKRVWGCSALSFVGMLVIAFFPSLTLRLIGISMASFSSGLGELTYLQLSTRYESWNGEGVGYFASGTGAAGIVGALLWWIVRPLGVQTGLTLLSILPFGMLGSWGLLLPTLAILQAGSSGASSSATYAPLSTEGEEEIEEERASREGEEDEEIGREDGNEDDVQNGKLNDGPEATSESNSDSIKPQKKIKLSFSDKMALLKPMLMPYIFPLVLVYLFEYTINQGIAPTLLYPLPTKSSHPLLSLVIKRLSDYYPLYQTIYQLFVFISRSSVSLLHLPAIPKKFLWLPAIAQGLILATLFSESLYAWFRNSINSPLVMVLICCEGLAGGAAYVSVFYSIGTEAQEDDGQVSLPNDDGNESLARGETSEEKRIRKTQEFEFRIGSVGFGDSLGILVAALVAMPLELWLCNQQAKDGRTLCKEI